MTPQEYYDENKKTIARELCAMVNIKKGWLHKGNLEIAESYLNDLFINNDIL
jgi:hypothetical protein